MPEYSFVLAGRVGVGKSSLFAYIKNGMAPSEYSGDIGSPSGRRNEDYGLENLTYETIVNDREASVSIGFCGVPIYYDNSMKI
jgi:GTPase SAR1 family protein